MALEVGESTCQSGNQLGPPRTFKNTHQCPFCEFQGGKPSHIVRHITTVHIRDLPYKCSHCTFRTSYPLALESHFTKTHCQTILTSSDSKDQFNLKNCRDSLYNSPISTIDPKEAIAELTEQTKYIFDKRFLLVNNNFSEVDEEEINGENDSSDGERSPFHSRKTINNLMEHEIEELSDSHDDDAEPVDADIDEDESNTGPEIMQVALNPFDYALPSNFEDVGWDRKDGKRHRKERRRQPNTEKLYVCSECSQNFNKSKHLKGHMKTEHGRQLFPCTQCDFTAPQSGLLKYHVQGVHKAAEGFLVHQCPQCPYCTASGEKLRTHIRVKHNRLRPYKCPQCAYSSTQAGHIRIHVRAKHTNEKPYHCSYCGYQSAYSSALKSHITKRHTNN